MVIINIKISHIPTILNIPLYYFTFGRENSHVLFALPICDPHVEF